LRQQRDDSVCNPSLEQETMNKRSENNGNDTKVSAKAAAIWRFIVMRGVMLFEWVGFSAAC
jgi:hypothetical protein